MKFSNRFFFFFWFAIKVGGNKNDNLLLFFFVAEDAQGLAMQFPLPSQAPGPPLILQNLLRFLGDCVWQVTVFATLLRTQRFRRWQVGTLGPQNARMFLNWQMSLQQVLWANGGPPPGSHFSEPSRIPSPQMTGGLLEKEIDGALELLPEVLGGTGTEPELEVALQFTWLQSWNTWLLKS